MKINLGFIKIYWERKDYVQVLSPSGWYGIHLRWMTRDGLEYLRRWDDSWEYGYCKHYRLFSVLMSNHAFWWQEGRFIR